MARAAQVGRLIGALRPPSLDPGLNPGVCRSVSIKKTACAVIERGGQDLTDGMKQILALAEEVDGDLWALIDAADGIPPDPEDAAG